MATEWFAAVNGTAQGQGTKAAPWDLATALAGGGGKVRLGDTLSLRGGIYRGHYVGTLAGTPAAPITVRSAPGELAVLDGFATTTLAAAMPASGQVPVTLADASAFQDGAEVTIDGEQLRLISKNGNTFTGLRSLFGTPAAAHAAGAQVVLGGNVLTVRGQDTIYRDLEILYSDPVRTGGNAQNGPRLRGACVWHEGTRTRVVNCVIHDGALGVFASGKGVDTELYGCLIYNNGYLMPGTVLAGDGVYGQNAAGEKLFHECVVWNNFRMGVKQESQNADTVGMRHVGIIGFNNGSPIGLMADGVNPSPWRQPNLFVGANNGKADDITVQECYFYHPRFTSGNHGLKLGYSGLQNGKMSVTDSVLVAGMINSEIVNWSPLTFRRNRVVNLLEVCQSIVYGGAWGPGTQGVDWDGNAYWHTRSLARRDGFNLAGSPFAAMAFPEWQTRTGFDGSSVYDPLLPAQPWAFVRPNKYERGRANVAVYNWHNAPSVPVDLTPAGLQPGQAFTVKNVQNWHGPPILTGIWDPAKPVYALPFSDTTVEAPLGHNWTPRSTVDLDPKHGPGSFLAAVVLPSQVVPPPPPPPPPLAQPQVTGMTPNPARVGDTLTVTGTAFGLVPGMLRVDSTTLGAATWTDTLLTVAVPSAWSAGTHTLQVVRADGVASSARGFTVQAPAPPPPPPPAPNITGGSAPHDPAWVGDTVTIDGTAFGAQPGRVVVNGTVAARVTGWSDTRLTVLVEATWTVNAVNKLTVVRADGVASGNGLNVSVVNPPPPSTKKRVKAVVVRPVDAGEVEVEWQE